MCVSDSFPVPGAGGGGAGEMAVLVETERRGYARFGQQVTIPMAKPPSDAVGRTANRAARCEAAGTC